VVAPYAGALTELASLVFPQLLPSEYSGSFMNMEGRIQRFEAGPENIHYEMRPVWSILGEFSDLMETGTVWYHDSQVREKIAESMGEYEKITNIPQSGMITRSGKEGDLKIEDIEAEFPPRAGSDLPYMLHWTPSVHHNSWITQKSATLMNIVGKQEAWIHPDDAEREGIESGQNVRIGNRETAINTRATVTDKVNKGEILIVNSFENNPVNRLMNRGRKVTFVSVSKV
jgi:predicted molibdopterin-dependent oxidoreductase YjgC